MVLEMNREKLADILVNGTSLITTESVTLLYDDIVPYLFEMEEDDKFVNVNCFHIVEIPNAPIYDSVERLMLTRAINELMILNCSMDELETSIVDIIEMIQSAIDVELCSGRYPSIDHEEFMKVFAKEKIVLDMISTFLDKNEPIGVSCPLFVLGDYMVAM